MSDITRRPENVPVHRARRVTPHRRRALQSPRTDSEEIVEIMRQLNLDDIHYLLAVARTLLQTKNKNSIER